MLAPVLIALLAAGGYALWKAQDAPPAPALPEDLSAIDPEVAQLVRSKAIDIEADGRNGAKHGSLGLVYEANSMWPEAVRSFANAAALEPDEPLWGYHQARAMINAGDQEGGYALLVTAAARVPNVPGVQLYLAHELLDAGELDAAQQALNNVVREAPGDAKGYAGLGELLVAREDYAGAVSVLRRALDIDPNLAIAHYTLGLAYRGVGQLEDAERELNRGLGAKRQGIADRFGAETQQYGVNYVGVINRSSDLIEAGQFQAAVDQLERLRKSRPDDTNLLNNLGIGYMRLARFGAALEHLSHALELDDSFFATHQNVSACYRETGELEKALKHAQRSVELGADVSSTHLALMQALALLGRFDEAYASGQNAVRLDPGDPLKHLAVGEVAMRLRLPLEARRSFESALGLAPAFLPARYNLVRILIGLGELERAEEVLVVGEEAEPENPRILDCRRALENARRQRQAAQLPSDG